MFKIILRNVCTMFNLVNLILALMIISVGSYKNLLFVLIAIANTLIGIINEIRAKKTIDKLRLISEQKPTVIRDGKSYQIPASEIKKGDLMSLALGDQILVDATVEQGSIEVNESFITGEQDNIHKNKGDKLISGSFIVSGSCKAKATTDIENSLVKNLENSAKTIKTADSKLFTIMNNIVKYISIALIPIGALLLWSRFRVTDTTTEVAVTSTVAALINMIPEGLVLLTSSVLALATIRLSRQKVLVQDLYSIETLARVDCIALDKTGTLTTGKMKVHDYTALENSFESALASILSHQSADNATISALKKKFLKRGKFEEIEGITEVIDFSSDRKHSGIKTKNATYLLGAIDFLTDDPGLIEKVTSEAGTYRTLAIVKISEGVSDNAFSESISRFSSSETYIPDGAEKAARRADFPGRPVYDVEDEKVRSRKGISDRTPSETLLGFIRLEDELRSDAKDIIKYFYDNNIEIKIISGDDKKAVSEIAEKVGVKDIKAINLSDEKHPNYDKLAKDYNIFTRVTPSEKRSLIKALKKQGKTVAMTGDGVNDILAMKEADCAIAIGEGSDAARRSAKLVLLDSDFKSVPRIIAEGRQSINNLERSTTLFLTKTIYASILAVLFVILPLEYPYAPIEMSLLNFVCIGLPGLVLALEPNTERVKNQFVKNIKKYSVPTGLFVAGSILTLAIVASIIHIPRPELTLLSALITFVIGFVLVYRISKPLNLLRTTLLIGMLVIFGSAFLIPPFLTLLTL